MFLVFHWPCYSQGHPEVSKATVHGGIFLLCTEGAILACLLKGLMGRLKKWYRQVAGTGGMVFKQRDHKCQSVAGVLAKLGGLGPHFCNCGKIKFFLALWGAKSGKFRTGGRFICV